MITQSSEEQQVIQSLASKVQTVIQNLILTGEGEELVREGGREGGREGREGR